MLMAVRGSRVLVLITAWAGTAQLLGRAPQEAPPDAAPTLVWASPTLHEPGSVSPDGRFITFRDAASGQLALRDMRTGTTRLIPNTTTSYPALVQRSAIAPDGGSVAYGWFDGNDGYQLRVTSIRSPESPRTLIRTAQPVDAFGWTPDSQSIVIQVGGTPSEFQLVAVRDGAVRILRRNPEGPSTHLALSHDGQHLAFDLPDGNEDERDVFVLSLADGDTTAVARERGQDRVVGWSPRDDTLIFASTRLGRLDLWAVPVRRTGAATPRLLRRDVPAGIVGITADGRLLTRGVIGGPQVRIGRLDIGSGRWLDQPAPLVTDGAVVYRGPDWSPDGKLLAYLSVRERVGRFLQAFDVSDGRGAIVIREVETNRERELRPLLRFFQQPRWMPDSRALLVKGTDQQGREGVFTIAIDTGAVESVALSPGSGTNFPQISQDGAKLYFWTGAGLRGTEQSAYVERDLRTQAERIVYRAADGPLFPNLSRDGRYLVGATFESSSKDMVVEVIDVNTLAKRELLRAANIGQPTWTPDGRTVVVPQGAAILLIPVGGGDVRRVALPPGAVGTGGVRVHPDGERIAYWTGLEQQGALWAIENVVESR